VKKETVINRSYHHRYMSENAKELEPDLKQLLDVVVEGGENGVRLDEIFDKLQKDDRDTKVLIGVMDDLSQLREFGYIHRKIIERRVKGGIEGEIRWFAAGKGESIEDAKYGGFSMIPFAGGWIEEEDEEE